MVTIPAPIAVAVAVPMTDEIADPVFAVKFPAVDAVSARLPGSPTATPGIVRSPVLLPKTAAKKGIIIILRSPLLSPPLQLLTVAPTPVSEQPSSESIAFSEYLKILVTLLIATLPKQRTTIARHRILDSILRTTERTTLSPVPLETHLLGTDTCLLITVRPLKTLLLSRTLFPFPKQPPYPPMVTSPS